MLIIHGERRMAGKKRRKNSSKCECVESPL
jgi:hypothetical protein